MMICAQGKGDSLSGGHPRNESEIGLVAECLIINLIILFMNIWLCGNGLLVSVARLKSEVENMQKIYGFVESAALYSLVE